MERRMDDNEYRAGCWWMRMIYPDELEEYWIKQIYTTVRYRIFFSFPGTVTDSA